MTSANPKRTSDFTGRRVLILVGEYAGHEGVCLGKTADQMNWAISPDNSDKVLQLEFEKEFGLLMDLSSDPARN